MIITGRIARLLATVVLGLTIMCGCATNRGVTSRIVPSRQAPSVSKMTVEQIRAKLDEAARASPNDPLAQLEVALFDLRANDLHNAERELIAISKQFPRLPRAPYHLGLLYLTHGYETNALPLLRRAAGLAKDDELIQSTLALACFRTGNEAEARRYAEAAIRLDPQAPDAYLVLARLNDHHGTALQAIANVRQYLERSPAPAPGYYLMGRLYARQGDRANSELWIKRAIATDPNNADFWLALGRVYYDMFAADRADDGIRCFEKALTLNPNLWEAHQSLGRVMRDRQQWAAAIAHFEAALRSPTSPRSIQYDLGQALLKAGRLEEGRKLLAQFQSREKAKREYTSGFAKLNRAIDKAPLDRSRRYSLARFCMQYRQYSQAELVLREAEQRLGADDILRQLLIEAHVGLVAAQPSTERSGATPPDLAQQRSMTNTTPSFSVPNLTRETSLPQEQLPNGR